MTGKVTKKKKPGTKGKYGEWLKKENLMLIRGWRMNGATKQECAERMGIRLPTLCEWQNKYPEIAEALKIGGDVADAMVMNALFKNAVKGNTAAQIFWMKNRCSQHWSDEPKTLEDKAEQKARTEKLLAETRKILKEAEVTEDDVDQIILIDDCEAADEDKNDPIERADHTEV